jgi:hypothetical protein
MAVNYSYFEKDNFRVIKTHVSNIKNLVIKQPLCSANNYGINGGFFYSGNGYDNPPTIGLSINWAKGQTANIVSSNGNNYKRGTLVTYFDTEDNQTYGVITRATSITEIKQNLGLNLDYRNIIGGGSLALQYTNSEWLQLHENIENWDVNGQYSITQRSAIGIKVENSKHMVYMIVSKNNSWHSFMIVETH